MERKVIDIQKKYSKRTAKVSKEQLKVAIDRADTTMYLEEETHFSNGESEFVYRMHIQDNFK